MTRVSLALILSVAACGGSSSTRPSPPAQPDFLPMCKRIFARKATCADAYLPVLLDLRVELNNPPGIGDRLKVDGRDALLEIAHTELARDTDPATVAALCESVGGRAPAARVDQLLQQGARCEAAADCNAFAVCVVEIDRSFLTARR